MGAQTGPTPVVLGLLVACVLSASAVKTTTEAHRLSATAEDGSFPEMETEGAGSYLDTLKTNPILAAAAGPNPSALETDASLRSGLSILNGDDAVVADAEAKNGHKGGQGLESATSKSEPKTPKSVLLKFLETTSGLDKGIADSMDQVVTSLAPAVGTNPALAKTSDCSKERSKGFRALVETMKSISSAVQSDDKQKTLDVVTVAIGEAQGKLESAIVDTRGDMDDMILLEKAGIGLQTAASLNQNIACNLQRVTLIAKMKLYTLFHIKRFVDQCMFGADKAGDAQCHSVMLEHVPKVPTDTMKLPDGAAFKPPPASPSLTDIATKTPAEASSAMLDYYRVTVDAQIAQVATMSHYMGLAYESKEMRADDLSDACAARLKNRVERLVSAMNSLRAAMDAEDDEVKKGNVEDIMREQYKRGVERLSSLSKGYMKKLKDSKAVLSQMKELVVKEAPLTDSSKVDKFGKSLMCNVNTITLEVNQEIIAISSLMESMKLQVAGTLNAALSHPNHHGEFMMELNEHQ